MLLKSAVDWNSLTLETQPSQRYAKSRFEWIDVE